MNQEEAKKLLKETEEFKEHVEEEWNENKERCTKTRRKRINIIVIKMDEYKPREIQKNKKVKLELYPLEGAI